MFGNGLINLGVDGLPTHSYQCHTLLLINVGLVGVVLQEFENNIAHRDLNLRKKKYYIIS